jgi:hypothetical protein
VLDTNSTVEVPMGSPSFTKRQKERARQEKQRMKTEERLRRKREKALSPDGTSFLIEGIEPETDSETESEAQPDDTEPQPGAERGV